MPVVSVGPWPLASDISKRARSLINDMSQDVAGDLLADDQPYTFILMQSAYEELQDRLIDANVATYAEEAIIPNVPASITIDRAAQTEISFTGTFIDGNSYATPALPSDLLEPLSLSERVHGSTCQFVPMHEQAEGKPSFAGRRLHRTWDWRQDSIFIPNATQAIDIKVRYLTYAPAIVDGDSVVQILNCTETLAQLLAARFAASRGSANAATLAAAASAAIDRMTNRENKRRQRRTYRRRRYRSGSRCR